MESILPHLNLKPDYGFFSYKMSVVHIKTRNVLAGIIIDLIDFSLQQPSNYDLRKLTFLTNC